MADKRETLRIRLHSITCKASILADHADLNEENMKEGRCDFVEVHTADILFRTIVCVDLRNMTSTPLTDPDNAFGQSWTDFIANVANLHVEGGLVPLFWNPRNNRSMQGHKDTGL